MNQEGLLAEILECPNETVTWLVFADWLEERGEYPLSQGVRLYQAVRPALKSAWLEGMNKSDPSDIAWPTGRNRCRLATVLNIRCSLDYWPISWCCIGHWPAGVSAENCQQALHAKLLQVELACLGFTIQLPRRLLGGMAEEFYLGPAYRIFSSRRQPSPRLDWDLRYLNSLEQESCYRVLALARAVRCLTEFGTWRKVRSGAARCSRLACEMVPRGREQMAFDAARGVCNADAWRELEFLGRRLPRRKSWRVSEAGARSKP